MYITDDPLFFNSLNMEKSRKYTVAATSEAKFLDYYYDEEKGGVRVIKAIPHSRKLDALVEKRYFFAKLGDHLQEEADLSPTEDLHFLLKAGDYFMFEIIDLSEIAAANPLESFGFDYNGLLKSTSDVWGAIHAGQMKAEEE